MEFNFAWLCHFLSRLSAPFHSAANKIGYKVSLGLAWQITFQTNAAATFFIKILVAAALFHVCNAICYFTKPRSYSCCVLNKSSLHSVLLSPPAVSVVMLALWPLPALRGFSGTNQRLYCICHDTPLHCVSNSLRSLNCPPQLEALASQFRSCLTPLP